MAFVLKSSLIKFYMSKNPNFYCKNFTTFGLGASLHSRKAVPNFVITHGFHSSAILCNKQKAVSTHVRKDDFAKKVGEATTTTGYGLVVVAGIALLGAVGYALFKQLLAPLSPQRVYSDAVSQCAACDRVADRLGEPLKFHGEESRRNRNTRISHVAYQLTDGTKGIRLMFHVKGSRTSGRAHCDVREDESGWHYRYLYVEPDTYPSDPIIIQDNRAGER